MIQRKCPSCGAEVPFRTSIALIAVCPYCRCLVQRKDLDLEKLGQEAQLQADGSPLQLGARGEYRGAAFELVGRVQMRLENGFWNEWAMMFADQRQGWLGEAQGVYAVSFRVEAKLSRDPRELKPGERVEVGGTMFRVRARSQAAYVAAEGELPFRPPIASKEKARMVDLVAPGGKFATADCSESPPLLFLGEYQDYDALKLSGVRRFEGWSA